MAKPVSTTIDHLHSVLAREGFAFIEAESMRSLLKLTAEPEDWRAFTESWGNLAVDRYLADHGRFRRRRHAVYSVSSAVAIQRQPHQPHYQSRDYNRLYGGIERWFEPITTAIGDSASMRDILRFCAGLFSKLSADVHTWHVEVHQFRIEARLNEPGQPTPEGVHRDGVGYVLVLLIARQNIAKGTTTIHADDGRLLGSFTLAETFDAALVDDGRVFHGVTPVEPQNPELPAWRDVLVVTFSHEQAP